MKTHPVPVDWVAQLASANGGDTRATLYGLGEPWPLKRGWKKRLLQLGVIAASAAAPVKHRTEFSSSPVERQARYRSYLKSKDWKQKRKMKLARTSRCAVCGDTHRLDVHHLNYRDLYNVKMSDLRVFCRRCHDLAHKLHKDGVLRFRSDNHNSRFALTKLAVKAALGPSFTPHFRPTRYVIDDHVYDPRYD